MPRLKLTVQYAGTHYHGWQAQPDGPTRSGGIKKVPSIEGELQKAWHTLTGAPLSTVFHVAGRTDAGVHSWGNIAHIDTDWRHAENTVKTLDGLNAFLPDDIRICRVAVVDEAVFHARFTACERAYSYLLFTQRHLRPDLLGRVGHVRCQQGKLIDFERMQAALAYLPLGSHDFTGFRDAECQSKRPICLLKQLDLVDTGNGLWRLDIRADHFLHHMVRNIVGTLVAIGKGERPLDNLATVLASKDRKLAGKTFSPEGLYLTEVVHMPHKEWNSIGG